MSRKHVLASILIYAMFVIVIISNHIPTKFSNPIPSAIDPRMKDNNCSDIHYGIFPFVREDFPDIVNTWRKQAANLEWKPVDILKIVSHEHCLIYCCCSSLLMSNDRGMF